MVAGGTRPCQWLIEQRPVCLLTSHSPLYGAGCFVQTVRIPAVLLSLARTKYPTETFDRLVKTVLHQSRGALVRPALAFV